MLTMAEINNLFKSVEKLTQKDGQSEFMSLIQISLNRDKSDIFKNNDSYIMLQSFIQKIINIIDKLGCLIVNDKSILISLKNQKLLRTCFQLITSLGIAPSLLPGLGIPLSKRCSTSFILPTLMLTDEQKYNILVDCAGFFTRCYGVPVFKNILITFHFSDYLAILIQLCFAPLKKPGSYNDFVMTKEMYDKFIIERKGFVNIYKNLVTNSFQPMLMKELLVLQSVITPAPPTFVKKVIAKEMSQRLLCPSGLLSLMRCFIDSQNIDSGYDWEKVNMICQIVVSKHGMCTEGEYLQNICEQLSQILCLNNIHFISTSVACVLSLHEKYPEADSVKKLMKETFQPLDTETLNCISQYPGTILLPPQQLTQRINILHTSVSCIQLNVSIKLLITNLHILFLVGVKSTKNQEMNVKLRDTLGKCFDRLNKEEVTNLLQVILSQDNPKNIVVEEYEAGIAIKSGKTNNKDIIEDRLSYFISLLTDLSDTFAQNVFEVSLQILINLSNKRRNKRNKDLLLNEDEPSLLNKQDMQYINLLHLLSALSTSPKVVNALRLKPVIIIQFVEHFIVKEYEANDECSNISLVLLHTILSTSNQLKGLEEDLVNFIPKLTEITNDVTSFNHILSKEILSLINSGLSERKDSPYKKALVNVFDNLLPVIGHGLMQLTKLIDSTDPETISKKHYVFCIFQEHLKHADSYIYLAAINGLAALCTHCAEDVMHVLCKEFLQLPNKQHDIETVESEQRSAEQRMKIGDIIVKATRKLGEMVIIHKTTVLNTMLCGCRDDDPLLRTSALSNLAEIVEILHYKIGSIIYEVLSCVWSIIETDKAVECRRAAVMVISSLIKGLGKETLIQLKDTLLPIYRTLKDLYINENEDSVIRLHAQLALEELNDVVNQFLFPELKLEKQIFVLNNPETAFK